MIHFEATVKDGYIKLPERYVEFNNKKVIVDIINNHGVNEEKAKRVKNVKRFLRKYSGILKDTGVSSDLTIKEIREMRPFERIFESL